MQLIICNPITQAFSCIPFPPENPNPNPNPNPDPKDDGDYFQFAFECNSEKYRIFPFEHDYNEGSSHFGCKIYDSKEGVWKVRENDLFVADRAFNRIDFLFPVFHKGAIHFLSYSPPEPYIVAYNIESGISRILHVPEEYSTETLQAVDVYCSSHYESHIFIWGKVGRSNESICLVRFDREKGSFSIWVLMDYESSFWSKLLEISFEEMGMGKKDDFSVYGFTVMNGNSLVFGTKINVFSYDLIGQKETRLERICRRNGFKWHYLCFFPYSSTYLSCGIGATTF